MIQPASELLETARQAAELGADILDTGSSGRVRAKGDRDYVTDLDVRIQSEVQKYLQRETPEVNFLGEESSENRSLSAGSAFWVLDPIDGTSNFIHGVPLSAVSLALVQGGEPTVGVIIAPFLNLEYHAVRGLGSFRNGESVSASSTPSLRQAIVSIGDYAVGENAAEKNRHRLSLTAALASNVERIRMFGSAALDLAWVADGRTDACVIMSNKPWDVAAGVLLARESGAVVSDSTGNRHTLSSADTIAVGPSIEADLLGLLQAA
ncbi:inositol monophosphatase [Nocardia nova]|nr:inositol monophosphatase family protein [Nocardia nova]MBV7707631.1 inositol monophosphatase [Nocardia nova]